MATVRQDEVQLRVDFITDESRRLAKTIQDTKGYNQVLSQSQKELEQYRKEVEKAGKDEVKRAEALAKVAIAEAKVAQGLKDVAAAGKEASKIDLSKVTPAQLTERARQLAESMKRIPQSAPEFKQLETELKQVNTQLQTLRQNSKAISADGVQSGGTGGGFIGSVTGRVAIAVAAVQTFFAGLQQLWSFVTTSFAAADEAAKQDEALKSRIISTNAAAGKSFEDLIAAAEDLAKTTLFDDDQIKRGQELLLTFTNIRDEVYDETIPVLLDLNTTMKQDISTSAVQVGKALNDPIAGLKALSRIGVTFSAEQKQTIERMVEMGNVAGAQRVILAELRKEFGGSARAAAEAGAGGFQQLQKRFGEIKETLGGAFIAVLDRLSPVINFVVEKFEALAEVVTDVFSIPVSEKLREQQTEFNALIGVLQNVNSSEDSRKRAITELQTKYPQYIGNIDLHKATESQLNEVLKSGNDLFATRIFLQEKTEKLDDIAKRRNDLQKQVFEAEKNLQTAQNRTNEGRGFFGFGLSKKEEVDKFSNVVSAYTQQLQYLTDEENKFLQEHEAFAKRFNINTSDPAAGGQPTSANQEKISVATKTKKEADAAAGSIQYLQDLIAKLQKEIEGTPGESQALSPLILQLKQAEFQLAELQAKLDQIKNPNRAVSEDQNILNELAGGAAPAGDTALTESQKDAIVGLGEFRLEHEEETLGALDLLDLEADNRKRERARQRIQEEQDLAISAASTIAGAWLSIQRQRIDEETQDSIEALDADYKRKIAAAEGNNAQQARLQKEFEKKKAEIEREGARKRKGIAIGEAVIQTALNILKAIGPFAKIKAAIEGATQIAVIASQKFEKGGIKDEKAKFGFFGGRSHAAGGTKGYFDDGTQIEVEKDEAFAVVNKKNAPMLRLLSRINSAGGHGVPFFEKGGVPRFADGGLPQVNTTPNASLFASTLSGGSTDALAADRIERAALTLMQAAEQFPRTVQAVVSYLALENVATELNTVRDDAAL